MHKENNRTEIKICGLTTPDEAIECARLGADAIGFVFFPKSPRHLTPDQAREISASLPPETARVGVFVNESFDHIMERVERCSLTGVQLHGKESPGLIQRLIKESLKVYKALFVDGSPGLDLAPVYEPTAFILECSKGPLPGGNALEWDWGAAKGFGESHPLILAGGLAPGSVGEAITAAQPDAVDVSSGVESSPGKKDLNKVASFIEAVSKTTYAKKSRRIF